MRDRWGRCHPPSCSVDHRLCGSDPSEASPPPHFSYTRLAVHGHLDPRGYQTCAFLKDHSLAVGRGPVRKVARGLGWSRPEASTERRPLSWAGLKKKQGEVGTDQPHHSCPAILAQHLWALTWGLSH